MMNGELESLKASGSGDSDPFTLKMADFSQKAKLIVEQLNKNFAAMNKANTEMYTLYAADKGACVITLVDSFSKAFIACQLENKQREEAALKKTQKKKRKKIKKKKTSTSSKTKALMNAPKLSDTGEELAKEQGNEAGENQEDVLNKLFPGAAGEETADKKEDEDGEDEGGTKVKKVKKVKKIKKIKKVKKKKSEDGVGGGEGVGGEEEED